MIVSLEGNIGCGKSTIIERLSRNYRVFRENIEDWQKWLKLFYEDAKSNALGLQLKVLECFQTDLVFNVDFLISERSPYTIFRIFTGLLYSLGNLNNDEYSLCEYYYNRIDWKPNVIIYLKCSSETCWKRVIRRKRVGEENIDLCYLINLEERYEKIMKTLGVKLLEVNANNSIEVTYNKIERIINELYISNSARSPHCGGPGPSDNFPG